jgi:cardiolipin synthase
MLWQLLKWDVKVWYQPPPFAHTKLFVIDGQYALIGSANIDPRSLRLNYEIGVEVIDEAFGKLLMAHMDAVISASRPVTLEEVDGRNLLERFRDSLFWLFSPYL